MKSLFKRLVFIFLKRPVFWYLKKPRKFKYKNIQLIVNPDVFHPGLFVSTKILLGFLDSIELKERHFLELGAGSGAVGFYAENLGARVTLSDINTKAIDGLHHNAKRLNSKSEVIHSDLFDDLDGPFDIIVINPPYYPKRAENEAEQAWFCGSEFEYFHKLFSQLKQHIQATSKVFMILSEDCDLNRITSIANENGFNMNTVFKKRKWWEWNFIFEIQKVSKSA